MTVIALPAGFCPNQFSMRLAPVQRVHSSPFGGSEQVVDLLNDRWTASMSLPNRTHSDAAKYEAFIGALRGMANTANLYHFARQIPRGTMRGAPFVNGADKGAASIMIVAPAFSTLLAGDMIGLGGLLLQVSEDCIADGVVDSGMRRCVVPLVNRVRRNVVAGTAVIWDKPTAPFRLMSPSSVQYVPGYAEGISLDFAEAIV
ncbi:hypothetical protein [Variovorax sp. UMC13]|uniref:hypothetical protein n=1 Tax=Variovorax sp. UMC13 TaxID=1862326 RepID=UPI001601A1F9|nr:hypothetical protein [Variovorax sp. UMC13]MBB1599975.1 hypothetical protein [Variovorax sp. UMC13]